MSICNFISQLLYGIQNSQISVAYNNTHLFLDTLYVNDCGSANMDLLHKYSCSKTQDKKYHLFKT